MRRNFLHSFQYMLTLSLVTLYRNFRKIVTTTLFIVLQEEGQRGSEDQREVFLQNHRDNNRIEEVEKKMKNYSRSV